ncbi:beta galactosidase jelly roll domain-containing protein [Xenorhabdus cabanillasii]|uniref:beta galactosidase jelly roll domain-containing protein n=1 Tax=Xenorhabdus cabanillasii TaxID=351673 RepID=UPI000C044A01|nr:beta galactosidase jelly roll domain-containing protein [Xenorhabdus cabanillasii]PHM77920.1 tail fiber protein [Xenorhabdus cabanillasii JM26]
MGALYINNDNEWPGMIFEGAGRYRIGIEGTGGKKITIWANDANGNRRYGLLMPEKSGTLATVEDIMNLPMLGVGQSVMSLTSGRSLFVTYTNASGRPIAVYVRVDGGSSSAVKIFVNGIEFGSGHSTAMHTSTSTSTAFSIVPNGATYRAESAFSLAQWTELRE